VCLNSSSKIGVMSSALPSTYTRSCMQTSKDLRQRKLGKELMEEREQIEGLQKVSNHLP